MTKIQEEIISDLFSSLRESERVPMELIEALRNLLKAEGRLKPDDIVAAFSEAKKLDKHGSD